VSRNHISDYAPRHRFARVGRITERRTEGEAAAGSATEVPYQVKSASAAAGADGRLRATESVRPAAGDRAAVRRASVAALAGRGRAVLRGPLRA
jgi:hypothetical protein